MLCGCSHNNHERSDYFFPFISQYKTSHMEYFVEVSVYLSKFVCLLGLKKTCQAHIHVLETIINFSLYVEPDFDWKWEKREGLCWQSERYRLWWHFWFVTNCCAFHPSIYEGVYRYLRQNCFWLYLVYNQNLCLSFQQYVCYMEVTDFGDKCCFQIEHLWYSFWKCHQYRNF